MEYVLAFALFATTGNSIELAPEYQFTNFKECDRFVRNYDQTRQIILEKYAGQGYSKIIPACKQINRAVAMKILSSQGI